MVDFAAGGLAVFALLGLCAVGAFLERRALPLNRLQPDFETPNAAAETVKDARLSLPIPPSDPSSIPQE